MNSFYILEGYLDMVYRHGSLVRQLHETDVGFQLYRRKLLNMIQMSSIELVHSLEGFNQISNAQNKATSSNNTFTASATTITIALTNRTWTGVAWICFFVYIITPAAVHVGYVLSSSSFNYTWATREATIGPSFPGVPYTFCSKKMIVNEGGHETVKYSEPIGHGIGLHELVSLKILSHIPP